MDNIFEDVNLNYSTYGDGKAIIEILNIGFEPLLTPDEYKLYKEIGDWKYKKEACLLLTVSYFITMMNLIVIGWEDIRLNWKFF